MQFDVSFFLSLSIIIPITTGIIRYRQVAVSYIPLWITLIIGFITEISCFIIFQDSTTAIPVNIFSLLEGILILIQFKVWQNFPKHPYLFYTIVVVLTGTWITENLITGTIHHYHPVYTSLYSFTIILLSVNQLSYLVVNDKDLILKNPVFIICISFIVFFSYRIIVEIFYKFAMSDSLKTNIFSIQSYINVFCNILISVAFLCLPRKNNFLQL